MKSCQKKIFFSSKRKKWFLNKIDCDQIYQEIRSSKSSTVIRVTGDEIIFFIRKHCYNFRQSMNKIINDSNVRMMFKPWVVEEKDIRFKGSAYKNCAKRCKYVFFRNNISDRLYHYFDFGATKNSKNESSEQASKFHIFWPFMTVQWFPFKQSHDFTYIILSLKS